MTYLVSRSGVSGRSRGYLVSAASFKQDGGTFGPMQLGRFRSVASPGLGELLIERLRDDAEAVSHLVDIGQIVKKLEILDDQ